MTPSQLPSTASLASVGASALSAPSPCRLVGLMGSAKPADRQSATTLATCLAAHGFEPNDLDDFVYALAAQACTALDNQGALTRDARERRQRAEYAAAEEINGEGMPEQLLLLLTWHRAQGSAERFSLRLAHMLQVPPEILASTIVDPEPAGVASA